MLTDANERRTIAIGHLSDSGDLNFTPTKTVIQKCKCTVYLKEFDELTCRTV